jgi:hypothetical protein
MIIRKPQGFVDSYEALPDNIKKKTLKALELLITSPHHPSLRFKNFKAIKMSGTVE